jgi:hypothetical protein
MSDNPTTTTTVSSEDPERQAKDLWCQKALGADPRALAAEIKERLGSLTHVGKQLRAVGGSDVSSDKLAAAHSKASQGGADEQQLAALADIGDKVDVAIAAAQKELTVLGNKATVAGSIELINCAIEAIEKMNPGEIKTALMNELYKCTKLESGIDTIKDADEQQAACLELEKTTQGLLNLTKMLGGQIDTQKAYEQALKKRYNINISVPSGMKNTHFDKVYEMFARVPVQHTKTSSLKTLAYTKESFEGAHSVGMYSYGSAKITMGDFGRTTYDNRGYTEPANSFSISTLHEIGHSVDDKYKIMKAHLGDCGGWQNETADSVAKAVADDFMASAGATGSLPAKEVVSWVKDALTKGATDVPQDVLQMDGTTKRITRKKVAPYSDKPRTVKDADWASLQALLNKCVKMRMTEWPWGKSATVAISNRAYHESYAEEWVSYSVQARQALEVRDYQWRAPGEWFAEVYAYHWYHEKEPPGSIPAGVKEYLWKAPTK